MNILFICYWGLDDGLTTSTVLPVLDVLESSKEVNKIILITIEREHVKLRTTLPEQSKVQHVPLYSTTGYFSKIKDFTIKQNKLVKILNRYQVDLIIGHSSQAGAMVHKLGKESQVPYIVSLFEPHAAYMLESKVWKRYGLKYKFQKHWENLQKKNAFGLMPVAEGYKQELVSEGIAAERIFVVPCSVEPELFKYDLQRRIEIRRQLSWESATIGIYVGKFGGLYYEDEAFQIYKKCFELIPDFRMVILTPQAEEVKIKLRQHQLDLNKIYIASVQHHQVAAYLSAADFAFATYKPGPSKKYLSPVKIGEYWANGLPVLLTEGVGDDSDIIQNEGGGATFNLEKEGSLENAIAKIKSILGDPVHRQEIPKLAVKYRSPDKIKEAYSYFFKKLNNKQA